MVRHPILRRAERDFTPTKLRVHASENQKVDRCTDKFRLSGAEREVGEIRRELFTLFKASAETMLRIAADPKQLGARIGITSVLPTWGFTCRQKLPSSSVRRLRL